MKKGSYQVGTSLYKKAVKIFAAGLAGNIGAPHLPSERADPTAGTGAREGEIFNLETRIKSESATTSNS